ncbi:phosphatase PAP2 family protein [Gluconacetobacter diazotrophicus]|uniref:Putative 2 phosphatidic acid phosphatase (PAP2) protein n=2 Tax=Gluconacetobacter diazotrophicus TaxID=33996 RepID=A9HNC8_GLUDA|nr:putative 2 phosphatidic acid phosphatase (PAP2) protein [Gluconacetobacter diazotrophicus PA1 5]
MSFVTDLADQSVVIPLQIMVFVTFLLFRSWRFALVWGLVTCGGSGLILMLKLWFEACGLPPDRVLYSPSGHTMAGTMVYGCLLAVLPVRRSILMGVTVAIACVLGLSRVVLGCHTVTEVIVGGVVGVAVVGVFYRLAGPPPGGGRTVLGVLAVVAGIVALFHGYHSTVEYHIQQFSRFDLGPLFCRSDVRGA